MNKEIILAMSIIIFWGTAVIAENRQVKDADYEQSQEFRNSQEYKDAQQKILNEAAQRDPEQAENLKKIFEFAEKEQRGEPVDPKEVEKALMGSISKNAEKTFKLFIADPIPETVKILEGQTTSWMDTFAYVVFVTDEMTFNNLSKGYIEIPRGLGKQVLSGMSSQFGEGFLDNANHRFYRKIVDSIKYDKKYRENFYMTRDESSGKIYFQHMSANWISKDEEFPSEDEQVITSSTGEKEVKKFTFGEYEAEVEKFSPEGKLVSKWYIKGGRPANRRDYDENGKIRSGIYREYHDNGKVKLDGAYKDGMWDGVFKRYDEDGILSWEGEYRDYQRVGVGKSYHKNGNLKMEDWQEDGKFKMLMYDDEGELKNGTISTFDKNGVLKFESTYKDGVLHGVSKTFWDVDDNASMDIDGKMMTAKELKKENGRVVVERFYLNGQKVSEDEFKKQ